MTNNNFKAVPQGWGKDHLTDFLETAEHNRFATFVMMQAEYLVLRQLDDIFMQPSLTVWRVRDNESVQASLFHRAHGFYRAACGAAMAGQIAEAFTMCRAVLEAAAYALHICKVPGADKVWINRHEDGGLAAVKKQFSIKAVRESISSFKQDTDARFERLYQETIDMGAHPNERSISSSLEISDLGTEHAIRSLLLNPGGTSQQYAMISVARSGACALEMLIEVFPERNAELGLGNMLAKACKGL